MGAAVALIVTVMACDSGKGSTTDAKSALRKSKAASGCVAQAGETPAALAVRDYIKNSQPKPMRFLTAAGSDSAVPDDAFHELQDKGPTYYYAGTDAAKKKVRDKLELAGPFTALLVVVRGVKKNDDGTEVLRIGGHYLTGEYDGKAGDSRAYRMACDTAGWSIKNKQDEKGS